MRRTLAKITAAIILVGASLFMVGAPVQADSYRGGRGRSQSGRSRGRGQHERGYQNAPGAFWGGVLGGWIGQALRPDRQGTDVEGDIEPGSDAWLAYCVRKYRSFDPETGTYLGFDGVRKHCR